ncbi:MAG: GTP-binding protein [Candidatus Lokiarchaeota archaeon]
MDTKYILKLCLLGEANVGKTSLVHRFIENEFRQSYKATLGVNLMKKDLNFEKYGNISVQLWDLGGQESFKSLRTLYLEGANGALIVYDVTDRSTFDKLRGWLESWKNSRGEQPLVLIGNKSDLEDRISVSEQEGKEFAEKNHMKFLITSAKTGEHVEDAFKELVEKIMNEISQG